MGLFLFLSEILHGAVRDPFNDVILQRVLFDGTGHDLLNGIPLDVLFIAGLFSALFLAGIIVMLLAGVAGAAHTHHWAFTFATE